MAVKIRLSRRGAKKKAFYRIVVSDSQAPRDGEQVEVIGHYDPQKGIEKADFKTERVQYWLGCGAKPTGIVRQILKKAKPTSAKAA